MAYSLTDKIRNYLAKKHGLDTVIVTGTTVSAGGFLETIEGMVTKAKLDELAARIKARAGT